MLNDQINAIWLHPTRLGMRTAAIRSRHCHCPVARSVLAETAEQRRLNVAELKDGVMI